MTAAANFAPIFASMFLVAGHAATFRQGALALAVTVCEGRLTVETTTEDNLLVIGQERVLYVRADELVSAGNPVHPEPHDTFERTIRGKLHTFSVIPDPRDTQDQNAEPSGNILQFTVQLKSIAA